jgi:hypothetical protein
MYWEVAGTVKCSEKLIVLHNKVLCNVIILNLECAVSCYVIKKTNSGEGM